MISSMRTEAIQHLTTDTASPVSLPDIPHDKSVERTVFKLAQRIREEFEEAPEVRLTLREASQFWGLDESMCKQVFARLLATGFLSKDGDERYSRR
jgi:Fic family protein